MHNDLLSIMQEKAEEIQRILPNNSFKQLFWKQQFEAAIKSNSKQMRWHPLMIKWCLSIKLKSSTTYEALTVAGSGLFSVISHLFLRNFSVISLKTSRFPTISRLFLIYFKVISHFSIISRLFPFYFSFPAHFSVRLPNCFSTIFLISQLDFPTISWILEP